METPHSILKKFFGYDSFRPGQEQIVQRLLAGQDVLAVMPTGSRPSISTTTILQEIRRLFTGMFLMEIKTRPLPRLQLP